MSTVLLFFLIIYLFIWLHQVLVAALQIFNLHLQHAGFFFFMQDLLVGMQDL